MAQKRKVEPDFKREIKEFKLGIIEGVTKLSKYQVISSDDALDIIEIIMTSQRPSVQHVDQSEPEEEYMEEEEQQ